MTGHIDAHGHLGEYGPFHAPRNSADDLVRRMDALGVARLVLSAHAAFSSDYRWGNDLTAAAAARHPGRLFGYAVVNPNYPEEASEELERCFITGGFAGIKLHPATHQHRLEDTGYQEVWKQAERHRCPVLVHYWEKDPWCGPENLRQVAARQPGVQLVLAHLGGTEGFRRMPALAREFPNLWFDTSGSRHPRGMIEWLVGRGLAGRLLYGSDMPFIDPGSQLGKVLYADIPGEARAAILGGNARRLFGWEG